MTSQPVKRKWRRRIIVILIAVAVVGLSVACYSLQPSLSLAYLKNSEKQNYEMMLHGEPFTMPYRIMAPEDAGPSNSYPIVLYLCGSAQCGTGNVIQAVFDTGLVDRLAKDRDGEFKSIVIAPQIPRESLAMDEDILSGYMGIVDYVIEQYGADSDRVYVVGFSMGADSIWGLLELYPYKIAAAVPICGGLEDISQAETYKDVPIWIFHGRLDYVYPVKYAREMAKTLEDLGCDVRYTEYKFNAHVCWHKAYSDPDLFPWMFAQKKAPLRL